MGNHKSKVIGIGVSIVVLIVAGLGFWYWQSKRAVPTISPGTNGKASLNESTVSAGFGAQVLEKTQNPIKDRIPDINPFPNTETNPLKRIIKNPF